MRRLRDTDWGDVLKVVGALVLLAFSVWFALKAREQRVAAEVTNGKL